MNSDLFSHITFYHFFFFFWCLLTQAHFYVFNFDFDGNLMQYEVKCMYFTK